MILFAGDCHGDFVPVIEEAGEASAVVLLGDQEPRINLADELGPGLAPKARWGYGNHDSDYVCFFERHETMPHHFDGHTAAHTAAEHGRLPPDFPHMNWADSDGLAVGEVIRKR